MRLSSSIYEKKSVFAVHLQLIQESHVQIATKSDHKMTICKKCDQ